MATVRWRGDAPAVAQIQSWSFGGTWESGDLIRVTIGGKTKDFAAGSTSTSTVVANLVAAWNALSAATWPEFAELTASQSTTTFKLTADTAGKPFAVSLIPLESDGSSADSQTIEGGTTAMQGTNVAASSGPNDWSTAANWSGGAVPADGDDVCLEDSTVDILYGLHQASIQPASLAIAQSYSGKIGLPALNQDSASGSYFEYRERYLRLGAATILVGRGEGAGSQRINLDTGSDATALHLFQTGPAESGRERTVQWIGSHASNGVNVVRGSLGIALEAGQAATIATLRVGYADNGSGESEVRIGENVTLETLTQAGGSVVVGCAADSITLDDGLLTLEGAGAIDTLTIRGGRCLYHTTGTLTTGSISGNGELDFSHDLRAKTISNPLERHGAAAKVKDPYKVVGSLIIDNNETADLAGLELGTHIRVTRGSVS